MIKSFIYAWEEHKPELEEYIRNNRQESYGEYRLLLELLIKYVFNNADPDINYDTKQITEVDNGSYQGSLIFLFPRNTYQPDPSDYLFTCVYYGSCSGCDTLLGISRYYKDLPNEEQVKDYMELLLHLLQQTKYLFPRDTEEFDYQINENKGEE